MKKTEKEPKQVKDKDQDGMKKGGACPPKRASGGRVGAESSPYTAAKNTTPRKK